MVWEETFSPYVPVAPYTTFTAPGRWTRQYPLHYGPTPYNMVNPDSCVTVERRLYPNNNTSGPSYYGVLKLYRRPNYSAFPGNSTHPAYWNCGILRTVYDDALNSGHINDLAGYCGGGNPDNDPGGFMYGMFEVRCKLPREYGNSFAFWLASNNAWPPEIDAFETSSSFDQDSIMRGNSMMSTTHWNTTTGHCQHWFKYPKSLSDEFHTWTIVWTPTEIAWYLDGIELKTDNNPNNVPGHKNGYFNLGGFNGANYNLKCALKWQGQHLILNNGMFIDYNPGNSMYIGQQMWNYHNGRDRMEDMVIEWVRVFRPAPLSRATTGALPFAPARMPLNTSDITIQKYVTDTLLPAYANTPFRSAQSDWNNDFLGWDLYEYSGTPSSTDWTPAYKIGTPPFVFKNERSFVLIDAEDNKLKMAYGSPTANNPNRYSVQILDNTPLIIGQKDITAIRPSATGNYNIYYRRNANLYCASGAGSVWNAPQQITNATDVAGALFSKMDNTTEVVLYRNTANKLVELRRNNGAGAFTKTIITTGATYYNNTTAAPSDVKDQIIADPTAADTYYYRNTTDKMVQFYKTGGAWKYRVIAIAAGASLAKMQATILGDATWQRIVYTTTGGQMYQLNPATYAIEQVVFAGNSIVGASDFATGNNFQNGTTAAGRKTIYYKDLADNKLYVLTWNNTTSKYDRLPIENVSSNMNFDGVNNILVNGKDTPVFHFYSDGRMRQLSFTPAAAPVLTGANSAAPNPGHSLPCGVFDIHGNFVPIGN